MTKRVRMLRHLSSSTVQKALGRNLSRGEEADVPPDLADYLVSNGFAAHISKAGKLTDVSGNEIDPAAHLAARKVEMARKSFDDAHATVDAPAEVPEAPTDAPEPPEAPRDGPITPRPPAGRSASPKKPTFGAK